jgi:hypothetical protein
VAASRLSRGLSSLGWAAGWCWSRAIWPTRSLPRSRAFDGTGSCLVEIGDGKAVHAVGDFYEAGDPRVRLHHAGRRLAPDQSRARTAIDAEMVPVTKEKQT